MNEILKHELRGAWLGLPKAYQPLDFIGAAMGSYFIYDAVRHPRDTAWINIALGAIMIYIHTQRFFYAPQSKEGFNRLVNALEITPADICPPTAG